MTTRIKLRRDTAANWTSVNPVLSQGEPGLETDTSKVKYGDGTTAWNDLDYSSASGSGKSKRWVAAINTCGNGQASSTSTDGVHWSSPVALSSGNWNYNDTIAVGADVVVYRTYNYMDYQQFLYCHQLLILLYLW